MSTNVAALDTVPKKGLTAKNCGFLQYNNKT